MDPLVYYNQADRVVEKKFRKVFFFHLFCRRFVGLVSYAGQQNLDRQHDLVEELFLGSFYQAINIMAIGERFIFDQTATVSYDVAVTTSIKAISEPHSKRWGVLKQNLTKP
ncbi:hypothetical protein SADUNF_Sadunf16G0169800 [Salix dunnii]|uniref:Uncharacterized protein n=1 Tax=Salix dunnii TaxID=1413687 RepID=A0A835MH75_9ROSI|nr:hypothetical protein SADUNF_Sadunf16G0169800 [Salix dunnii]